MPFDLSIRTIQSSTDIRNLLDFVHKQDLGYPRYHEWVERAEHELKQEWKKGIIASSYGHVIGDVIYQPHKTLARVTEMKNLRIDPQLRRRDLARFMLRQLEEEAKANGHDAIMTDARSTQTQIIDFLKKCGYIPLALIPLYDAHTADVVLTKPLTPHTRDLTLILK